MTDQTPHRGMTPSRYVAFWEHHGPTMPGPDLRGITP